VVGQAEQPLRDAEDEGQRHENPYRAFGSEQEHRQARGHQHQAADDELPPDLRTTADRGGDPDAVRNIGSRTSPVSDALRPRVASSHWV
jgi:hypothetical protein